MLRARDAGMSRKPLSASAPRRYGAAMNSTTTTGRLGAHPLALPNILTYGRIVAVPIVVGCMFWQNILHGSLWLRWVALAFFIAAAISDFLDGYFARIWAQQSSLGRMLDPIADKLLVASCLLMLAAEDTIHGWSLFAAIVILCREILVSGLREYLAELRVSVPVTQLAKWKTTLQLVAVGFLIAGRAGDAVVPGVTTTGITLLWLSALLTLYTGWDYLQAGLRHLYQEDA
jgi:cardiolipin synthase